MCVAYDQWPEIKRFLIPYQAHPHSSQADLDNQVSSGLLWPQQKATGGRVMVIPLGMTSHLVALLLWATIKPPT